MEMKSVSIPIELHTWLYKNINTDRKSLYAVIEWLRDCKEHSDRGGNLDEFIGVTNTSCAILVKFTGDKPQYNEHVEVVPDTIVVRTTHDMSKAIGFRVFDPITREPDQILITFNVAESLRNRRLNDKKDDTQ